ncbi:MAG: HAD family hydrolase [Candidatus Hodarchaeota archaeon]
MMIKGIIFDFGFTLFYFNNPSVERYLECFKRGLLQSIDILKEEKVWNENITINTFLKKFGKMREHFFRRSIKTKTEFPTSIVFQNVLESLKEEEIISNLDNITEDTYKKLAEIYHCVEEDEWQPFDETRETLEKLAMKSLKIALISNHPNHKTIKNILKKFDLVKYFDVIITSAKFGKRKPDPTIFNFTLEKMGLKNQARSVIMCGDEYADIIGAQRANLQSVLFERKYKFPFERELNVSNLRKISNISEILNFIE